MFAIDYRVPTIGREFYIRSTHAVLCFEVPYVLGGTECAVE